MSSILKGKEKRLDVDGRTVKQLSDFPYANKLLEETLFFWIVSNEPSGKGGDINDRDIREMAIELAQDPRFGDDPNFKFIIGWFEGKIQQLSPIMHIINADKFTAAGNNLPS